MSTTEVEVLGDQHHLSEHQRVDKREALSLVGKTQFAAQQHLMQPQQPENEPEIDDDHCQFSDLVLYSMHQAAAARVGRDVVRFYVVHHPRYSSLRPLPPPRQVRHPSPSGCGHVYECLSARLHEVVG